MRILSTNEAADSIAATFSEISSDVRAALERHLVNPTGLLVSLAVIQEWNARILRQISAVHTPTEITYESNALDSAKVRAITRAYIAANKGCFAWYDARKTKDAWLERSTGMIAGRYTLERDGTTTLAIPSVKLGDFAIKHGVSKRTLKQSAKGIGAKPNFGVKLQQDSKTIRCFVFPNVRDSEI